MEACNEIPSHLTVSNPGFLTVMQNVVKRQRKNGCSVCSLMVYISTYPTYTICNYALDWNVKARAALPHHLTFSILKPKASDAKKKWEGTRIQGKGAI